MTALGGEFGDRKPLEFFERAGKIGKGHSGNMPGRIDIEGAHAMSSTSKLDQIRDPPTDDPLPVLRHGLPVLAHVDQRAGRYLPADPVRLSQVALEQLVRDHGELLDTMRKSTIIDAEIGKARQSVFLMDTFRATPQARCGREEFAELAFGPEPKFGAAILRQQPQL